MWSRLIKQDKVLKCPVTLTAELDARAGGSHRVKQGADNRPVRDPGTAEDNFG